MKKLNKKYAIKFFYKFERQCALVLLNNWCVYGCRVEGAYGLGGSLGVGEWQKEAAKRYEAEARH